jgi:hypothetical protein
MGPVKSLSQTKSDTTVQFKDEDTLSSKRRKGLSKPATAAILSTILPGTGQIYNKSYWKVPIVYILMGGVIYLAVRAQHVYNQDATIYREAYSSYPLSTNNFGIYAIPYVAANYSLPQIQQQISVQTNNDRNNRDEAYLITGLLFAINIVDACVDAHLKEFDVNEKIAMKIQPTFTTSRYVSFSAGLSVQFIFKAKNKIQINDSNF